jgi:hypothetical protein
MPEKSDREADEWQHRLRTTIMAVASRQPRKGKRAAAAGQRGSIRSSDDHQAMVPAIQAKIRVLTEKISDNAVS